MDKMIRNINEHLWREAKIEAAREGLSIKDLVERIIMQKLSVGDAAGVDNRQLVSYFHQHQGNTTKIIRGINPELWRAAKAQAALEGRSMKDWVEWTIAAWLQQRGKGGPRTAPLQQREQADKGKEKTKILRNINEQLWREAKARAFHEGITMKEWVEGTIRTKLRGKEKENVHSREKRYSLDASTARTKILRNIDEALWREAKVCSAREGKTMKEWVEDCIAEALAQGKV